MRFFGLLGRADSGSLECFRTSQLDKEIWTERIMADVMQTLSYHSAYVHLRQIKTLLIKIKVTEG